MIDRLEAPCPVFDITTASAVLEGAFGLSGELLALHGERDLNYRVTDDGGRRFLLKFHNPADGLDVVEMQTAALSHIGRVDPTLPVCKVVPGRDGAPWLSATASDGRTSYVRLLTFLDGRHSQREELDDRALFGWGQTVARLGRALRGFFHPAAAYEIQWDIGRTSALRSRLSHVSGRVGEVTTEVVDRFDARVRPVIASLRAQVIHNDMSRENVLVDEGGMVIGITDFGDMTHAALVCDLAVAIADVLDGRTDSLEMAAPMVDGYNTMTPLEDEEARILADLVAARCATALVVTSSRKESHPATSSFPEGAWQFLQLIEAAGFDQVASRFAGYATRQASRHSLTHRTRTTAELLAARKSVLGPLTVSYDEPIHLVRGDGVFVFGSHGQQYLDAYNNVPVVGHCHPEVVRAVVEQTRQLNTNTRYLHEASVELAERLLQSASGGLDRVLFVNSGSEANDVAWRIARFATGQSGAVVTSYAYHGVTEATSSLSPEGWPPGFSPMHVRLLPPPFPTGRSEPDNGTAQHPQSAREIETAVEELSGSGFGAAAFFLDPAFTSDGILGPSNRWVQQAEAAFRASGGLFVADEVQAGYGRTGEGLWSIATSGVQPDVMTLGKPMGNGFPIAAVITRSDIADSFMEATDYFSTFGGNTVACAAGLAVLRVVEEEGLVSNARTVGAYLLRRLDEVAACHDSIGQVRGWGMLAGIDIVHDESRQADRHRADAIANRLKELGVLVGTTGPENNVLKIRPPLVFDQSNADLVADRLDMALSENRGRTSKTG